MKEYNPKTCNECPFISHHFDDFSTGCMSWNSCSLIAMNGGKSYLKCDASYFEDDDEDTIPEHYKIEIPSKCPLRKEAVTVTLNNTIQ